MGRGYLAIDQLELKILEIPHHLHEGHLRSVRPFRKHGFSKKDLSQGNSVEPSHESPFMPAFHRMSIPHLVKLVIGLNHLRQKPGVLTLLRAHIGAALNDLSKGLIPRHVKASFPHNPLEASGDFQFLGKKHQPWVRGPP